MGILLVSEWSIEARVLAMASSRAELLECAAGDDGSGTSPGGSSTPNVILITNDKPIQVVDHRLKFLLARSEMSCTRI